MRDILSQRSESDLPDHPGCKSVVQEGSGKVGIGVSINLIESLEVSGAIRIGKSSQKRRGTIEYDSDKKDFIGYINDNDPPPRPFSYIMMMTLPHALFHVIIVTLSHALLIVL